ncbi:putative ribonuclease H-like domain-containing protein [Tanacetum coccineum]
MVCQLTKFHVQRVDMVINPPWNLPFLGAKGLTSPEQTATVIYRLTKASQILYQGPTPKDSPFDLEAYTDSDYAGASLDRKSTTRGCQFLRGRLISWQCKKQSVVANSTTEAEYLAASNYYG